MTWERPLGEGLPKADGEPRPTPVLRGLAQCVCGDVKAAVRLCVCNRLVRVGLGHGAPASQMGGHLLQCRGVCVCVCVCVCRQAGEGGAPSAGVTKEG